MPIRLSGMNSGLDTESLVSALVSSYRTKTQKYEKAQTKLNWKQDAWKSLNSKVYSFYTNISSLRYSSAYKLKKTSVSDSTKATITADNNAVNGTQSLNITSLAKSGYLTGGKLATKSGDKASDSTTLASLGFDAGSSGKVELNGKEINLSSNMTVKEAVSKFQEAGVNASFDETNQRIFISSTASGKDNDFSLTALDGNGSKALKSLGLNVKSDTTDEIYSQYSSLKGLSSSELADKLGEYSKNAGIVKDTDTSIANLAKAKNYETASAKVKEIEGKVSGDATALELLKDNKAAVVDGKIYKEGKDADGTTVYYDPETAELDEDGKVKTGGLYLKSQKTGDDTEYKLFEDKDAKFEDEGGKSLSTSVDYLKSVGITTDDMGAYNTAASAVKSFEKAVEDEKNPLTGAYADNSLASLKSRIDAGGTIDLENEKAALRADQDTAKAFVNNNAVLKSYAESYAAATDDSSREAILNELADRVNYASEDHSSEYNSDAVRVNGSDATIYLNGAKFTSSTNNFTINGLTINAQATTIDESKIGTKEAEASAISITTSTDSQGIYDKIKDFLSEYNSIINEMQTRYSAGSAKGYEPLTDEEREAMSEEEIKKWEDKIKDSLLRRDTTLDGIMSKMTQAMAKQYNIGGQNFTLASFGIQTLGFSNAEKNEQNAYHIYGDEDDSATSAQKDKLMAAINKDPDSVMNFFKELASGLYDAIGSKMGSTSLSSIYTIYNDKEMAKEYSDYTTTISKWENKVTEMEDKYYKQFAAMEKALATLNNSTSALSGLMG